MEMHSDRSNPRVITFALSLIEPLPSTEILAPVSSCSLLMVFPWGPSIFPTKLNCGGLGGGG